MNYYYYYYTELTTLFDYCIMLLVIRCGSEGLFLMKRCQNIPSVFKMVKLFPRTVQLCRIKSCFLPLSQSPTWSKAVFSLGEIGARLML